MIGVDRFASVFGGAPAHTAEHLTEHVRAVIRAGYSPVLCKPGGKETACILSAQQAKKADREAQQRALAMNPAARVDRIRHACGFKHVLDDPAKVAPIVNRFVEIYGGLNVALHLGRSQMLVVDVDTPAERQAFIDSWGSALYGPNGAGPGSNAERPGITVESPGSLDIATQQWVHWGGGHWWFELPDDFELPPGKVLKGPGGWAAMYGEAYALVPPATRPEGAYRLVGGTTEAPAWLLAMLTTAGHERGALGEGRSARARIDGGPIDHWSASVSWASLLEPAGWIETSMVEGSCGCPIWTAPGDHASPKSATAHDLACSRFDVSEGWGPLKIWTSNPPDGLPPEGAVTKLQFVAATGYGGDDGAAIRGLGIERAPVAPAWEVPAEWTTAPARLERAATPGAPLGSYSGPGQPGAYSGLNGVAGPSSQLDHTPDPFGTPGGSPPDPSVPQGAPGVPGGDEAERPSWAPVDLTPFLDGTYVEPPATLMPRSDGVCLLYPGLTHSIHGESESGKSWIVQAESARVIRAGGNVLYIDFESGPGPIVHRLLLLGCTPAQIAAGFFYVQPEVKPVANEEEYRAWLSIFGARFTLAVIDGVTDALGLWGLSTKDNDEFSAFSKQVPRRIAAETGAAVVLVDHVTKDKDGRGRFAIGGQAKMATLSGAAYVVEPLELLGKGKRGVLAIGVAKDRPGGVRAHGGVQDKNRVQPIAEFILDASVPTAGLMWVLNPPPVKDQTEVQDDRRSKIIRYLRDYSQSGTNEIVSGVGGKRVDVITTLQQLVDEGHVVIEKIGQKQAHSLITPINELLPVPGSEPVP